MVVLGVLSLVFFILSGTFGVLPTGNLGLAAKASSVVSDGFFQHLGWANDYIPLDQVALAITALLGLFGVVIVIRISLWALRSLHILGAGDD